MFEFTAKLEIKASSNKTWDFFFDIENWWVKSNPEHQSLEILSKDKSLKEGTLLRIHEKVAGIPAVAEGPVCDINPGKSVTWKADAIYKLWFIKFPIKEGVIWRLKSIKEGCELSANVWAEFPRTAFGRMSEWIFKNLLNGVKKDFEHAMCELRYIKKELESK